MRLTTGGPYDALLAGDGAWKQAVRIDVESHDLQNVVGLMVDAYRAQMAPTFLAMKKARLVAELEMNLLMTADLERQIKEVDEALSKVDKEGGGV